MSRKGYHDAMEAEQRELVHQFVRLKPLHEHTDGADRLRYALQLRRLQRRYRSVGASLQDLAREGDGIWEEMRLALRRLEDELAVGVERWIERLDAREAIKKVDREHEI